MNLTKCVSNTPSAEGIAPPVNSFLDIMLNP